MGVGDVRKVAVIGAGTMGPGLAQVFAGAGYPVSLFSRSEATLTKAMSVAAANVKTFVRHGLFDADEATAVVTRISPTQRLEEAGTGADLVIEAIAEDMDAKGAVFAELDAVCPDDAVLTSTTSYLDIYEVVPAAAAPEHGHRPLVRAAAHRPARRGGQGRDDE